MTPKPPKPVSENIVSCTNLDSGHTLGPIGTNKAQVYAQDGKLYAQLQGQDAKLLADLINPPESTVITGTIITYPSATIPEDWLECDGQEVGAEHTDLDTLLNDIYGTGSNGRSKVPDLRGRAVIGSGAGDSLTARALAASGGDEGVVLSVTEMPYHGHTVGDNSTGASVDSADSNVSVDNQSSSGVSLSSESNHTHSINHGHSMNSHGHSISDHSHSIPSHNHDLGSHDHSSHVHGGVPSSLDVDTDYITEGDGYSSTQVVTDVDFGYGTTNTDSSGTASEDIGDSGNWSGDTGSDGTSPTNDSSIAPNDHSGDSGGASTGLALSDSGHGHSVTDGGHGHDITESAHAHALTSTGGTGGEGNPTGVHNNMAPFLALICLIKI